MEKREQTQWAATYLVAAELTRRGYRVGWPMGNAPVKDLIVESPGGIKFEVDVKGGSYKPSQQGYWHIVQKSRFEGEAKPDLFFIFVRVDPNPTAPVDFFVVSHRELMDLNRKVLSEKPLTRNGNPRKDISPTSQPKHLLPFKGKWSKLPE